MTKKSLSSTDKKPCSCHDGTPCAGCKRKKVIKPQVYLEEPRKLPVPIVISHYKHKSPVTVNRATGHRWPFWRRREEPVRGTAICRWFRKRRALKQLKAEHERDRKRLQWDPTFRAQKEQEYEYFQEIYKQQAEKYQQEKERQIGDSSYKPEKPKKVKVKKEKVVKEKKPKKVKDTKLYIGKAASAKPRATSKCVSVRTYNRHISLNERFVNCFYRFCCQMYCCFTIVFLIGAVIIMLA